jgi:hypothetical protein
MGNIDCRHHSLPKEKAKHPQQIVWENSIIKESPVLFRAACPYPPYWGLYNKN